MKEVLRSILCPSCKEGTAQLTLDDDTGTFSVFLYSEEQVEAIEVPLDDQNPAALKCRQCGGFLVVDFDHASPDRQLTNLELVRQACYTGVHLKTMERLKAGEVSPYDAVAKLVLEGGMSEKEARWHVVCHLGGEGPTSVNEKGIDVFTESGRPVSEVESEIAELDRRLSGGAPLTE